MATIEEIIKGKRKEKEDKWAKRVAKLGTVANITIIIIVEKRARTQFPATWTPTTIKEVGDRFHQNFQASLQADPRKYMGVNLGCTSWV
jgi:hypothetical protein